ncbi:MAG TPA: ABC transporter permease subunit, partial [Thermococcus sp.]|nr:ABC transporter permease subunit [Thermococcus sp.]
VRRPALLPLITSLAISLGFMFGGATLAESVFRYPGIGYQYAQALGTRDYPLIMGIFTVIITAVLLATLVVELVYPLIDPRVREK